MLFRRRTQENFLRQSLLSRFKTTVLKEDGVAKEKQKVHRRTSDLSERARSRSLPSEAEFRKYLGPVDECLVEKAEIAKRRRRTHERRYSVQPTSPDPPYRDGEVRSKTMPLPRHKYLPPKQTPFNFVRCKWCEPIEPPTRAAEHKLDNDDETYIDENGIYTTVLCFTEI